jgi:uroporphyrinogen-III decarboxylase
MRERLADRLSTELVINPLKGRTTGEFVFAVDEANGKMALMGNINNPNALYNSSRGEVLQVYRSAIEDGVHILPSGCAILLTTTH